MSYLLTQVTVTFADQRLLDALVSCRSDVCAGLRPAPTTATGRARVLPVCDRRLLDALVSFVDDFEGFDCHFVVGRVRVRPG